MIYRQPTKKDFLCSIPVLKTGLETSTLDSYERSWWPVVTANLVVISHKMRLRKVLQIGKKSTNLKCHLLGSRKLRSINSKTNSENKQNEKPMLRTLLNFQPLNRLKNHFQLQWLSISLAHSWNLLLNNESLQPSVLSTTCRKQKLRKQWEYQKVPLRPTYITPEMHSAVRSASLKYKIGMEK